MYQVSGCPQFVAQRLEYFTDLSVLSLVERGERRRYLRIGALDDHKHSSNRLEERMIFHGLSLCFIKEADWPEHAARINPQITRVRASGGGTRNAINLSFQVKGEPFGGHAVC